MPSCLYKAAENLAERVADEATLSDLSNFKAPQDLDASTFPHDMWLRSGGSANIPQWPAFERYRDGKHRILAKSLKGFQDRHNEKLVALGLPQKAALHLIASAVLTQVQRAVNAELTTQCSTMALAETPDFAQLKHQISEIPDSEAMSLSVFEDDSGLVDIDAKLSRLRDLGTLCLSALEAAASHVDSKFVHEGRQILQWITSPTQQDA